MPKYLRMKYLRIMCVTAFLSTIAGAAVHAANTTPTPAVSATSASPVLAASLDDAAHPAAAVKGPDNLRSRWADRGFETNLSMTGLLIGDVAGGIKKGGVYNTLGVASGKCDLEKLTGWWKGGTIFASVYWIRGRSVSYEFVGDALAVSNLDGFDSIRLYDAWIEQSIIKDKMTLRVGSQSADEEFTGTDYGAVFTNSVFGWEAAVGANVVNGGPIYFAPALGVRADYKFNDAWTARVAAYDGDSFDSPTGDPSVNPHGLHFQLCKAQGMISMAQVDHTWNVAEGTAGLPGTLRLGAWDHTADFADNCKDVNGASFIRSGLDPAIHHGNRGWYGSMEQMVWNAGDKHEQGIGLWIRAGSGLRDRSLYEWVSDGGFNWTGAVPARDSDVLGVGVATAYVSRDLIARQNEQQALSGGSDPLPDYERVVETAYQAKLNDHWSVTPTLQWVQHPGTSTATRNAWVPGLRISVQ